MESFTKQWVDEFCVKGEAQMVEKYYNEWH